MKPLRTLPRLNDERRNRSAPPEDWIVNVQIHLSKQVKMVRQRPAPIVAVLSLLLLFLAACGREEPNNIPSVDTPIPVQPSRSTNEIATVVPTSAAPTPTVTPTSSSGPMVFVERDMNIRSGPGTHYDIVGDAVPGQRFPIIGVNPAGDWWQIEYNGGIAWIYAPFVQAENISTVTVVAQASDLSIATATPASPAPPTTTSSPDASADPLADLAPAPAPIGTVVVYETSVTLPTYPMVDYQSDARNETFNWPYQRFDWQRFKNENPAPQPQTYRLIVLENAFLKVTILPELGGRVWQAIHKPTGANMFYQNPVVKPSPWGPGEQLGWTAVGGLEWNLPVVEHGYDWGVEWGYLPLQHSDDLASVTVFTPRDGRYLNASVTVALRSGAASFEIEPTLSNLSNQPLDFAFWETALLAPGPGNTPGGETQFILPGNQMTVHSTEDQRLPGADQPFNWPIHNGVDYTWLRNWTHYLGFFEHPAAHGPFVGIYDHNAEAGAVRVYPATVAQGSKVFGLGWQSPLNSDNFTDDRSAYVELQGGLTPTFADGYRLPPGGAVTWREVWYPFHAIGGLTYADEVAALNVRPLAEGLAIGLYPTRPMDGALVVLADGQEVGRRALKVSPQEPFDGIVVTSEDLPAAGPLAIRFEDSAGRAFFIYTYAGPLR